MDPRLSQTPAPVNSVLILSLTVTLCTTGFLFLLWRRSSIWGSPNPSAAAYKPVTNPESRAPGEWRPRKFSYPRITSVLEPLAEIRPIEYRPFRPGTYNVTMGIRSMPWDEWIELDDQYERYYKIRKHRIETRGDSLIRVLGDAHNPVVGGGGLAAIELVHELVEYLVRRHPTTFTVTRHTQETVNGGPTTTTTATPFCDWGWEGAYAVKSVSVVPLGVTYDLPLHTADGDRAPERALQIASLLVQEDFALMIEGSDGKYYFQSGAIVIPGFWRLQDKIGLPLDEIHTSGDVPRYREKLQGSMERFFRRLQVDKPVARNNYFVQVVRSETGEDELDPEELGWSVTGNGREDEFSAAHSFEMAGGIEQIRLRTERQTLRRLGVSGAVVFTIRVRQEGIVNLGGEKGRLASAMRGWGEDVREYKGAHRGGWWEMVLEFLDDRDRAL